MTTIASSQGDAEVINARRTESRDAPEIWKIVGKKTMAQFNQVNIVHLIEKSNLAVTLTNDHGEVLGFAAFLDHPQVDVCDPANYETWMKENKFKKAEKSTPLNSLFLHYFVAKTDYTIGCATEIIRTVFNAVPSLHFLFLAMKKNIELEQALSQLFAVMDKAGETASNHNLFVCHRHDHVPVLHVRRATPEDHDDLVPLFNKLDNNLTETYGDYYLSEIIEAQDADHHCLVAEVNGRAVGFMSISAEVNVELLQNEYELDAFHGLRKSHPDDKLQATPPTTPPSSPIPAVEEKQSTMSVSSPVMQDERTMSVASASSITVAQQPSNEIINEETEDVASMRSTSVVESQEVDDTAVFETVQASASFLSHVQTEDGDVNVSHHSMFKPTYAGESNCFSIQLFAIDELHEMRSADFLPHIFKIFPDKDFVVLTTHHLVPEFPLLQHFIRVTPRIRAYVKQEVYLFHKSGNLANFNVRFADTSDLPHIANLVKSIKGNELILDDVAKFNEARRDEDGTEIQAFVAECANQIVGVGVFRREEDIEYIRSHYNIEDFIYFNHHRRDEHAHLHHFALNPVFQHYTKHFFKEMLRQGRKSCLYYPVYPDGHDQFNVKQHTLITGLNHLLPVRGRRQIIYPVEDLGINIPSNRVLDEKPAYALYHLNRKLTLEPKVTINARIVVVGASTTGLSLLDTLCFCPHLRFNNITLISKHGLPSKINTSDYCYSKDELTRMSLRTWINVVQGTMTYIDRAHKKVIMSDGSCVFYDHLVLCMGQQYHIPNPTGADIDTDVTNHDIQSEQIDAINEGACPENVMAVNTSLDMDVLTKYLEISENQQKSVVVYGNSMDAYTTIQFLMEQGVPGKCIHFVQPPVSQPITLSPDPFNEPAVFEAVTEALTNAGVTTLTDCILANWDVNSEGGVSAASFTTPSLPRKIPCDLFLSLHPRQIDQNAFTACNDSCLVFDGRLVIDADFCTNDPAIRAAGPLTKYARRYHAEDWSNHDGFNSIEIGFRLAVNLLFHFDPTADQEDISPDDLNNKLVPTFTECKAFQGVLPGGFNYFHARKPGLSEPHSTQFASTAHGKEIITGSLETNNYFRLHLSPNKSITTVTCLMKGRSVPSNNLIQLYNVHERYLNNLVSRVDEGLLTDFYEFFSEPWAMAIFHDRFKDLKQEVRELLSMPLSNNLTSIDLHVRQLVQEDPVIDSQQIDALRDFYKTTGQQKIISDRLLSFLSYNYYHLPMYAKPGMV